MPAIKATSEIAEKWSRVTPQRTEDFEIGVKNPRRDWATQTKAAEGAYAQGVQTAIQEKRFGKGVDKAGTGKWQENTATKGVDRWGPGVQAGQDAYEAGFSPYANRIQSTKLPPRFPKGDPRNIERVRVMAAALRNQKVKGA